MYFMRHCIVIKHMVHAYAVFAISWRLGKYTKTRRLARIGSINNHNWQRLVANGTYYDRQVQDGLKSVPGVD